MAKVYDLNGEKKKTVALPRVFNFEVRPDIIKRAVVAIQSSRLQPYGPNWLSGKETSAFSFGPGRGLSRIPRVVGGGPTRGRGSIVPQAVGGRRSHPPTPTRKSKKKINQKEKSFATASAISASADKKLVSDRGHKLGSLDELPLIVVDDLEKLAKARDVKDLFLKMGLNEELLRRGQKKKGPLIVVSRDRGIKKASENIPGVNVATAKDLNVEDLAPGAKPGRLVIYTLGALKILNERFKENI